ncbi:putative acyl-CoA dehydrogenase (plasmid) [Burkholderia sp. THE68]|uniref:acyl-CoA dehydrogenase family protein n=1 Tax=Burkholderiaceae TaxID=119060 RepID=UPI001318CF67|nr:MULTISPECIES: acyl-CoA dehydrogenase family protein [Burkholderiaceae]BBU33433.1 putative acyl-CoA dehydrogenase [Burkholderia sp. THE68]BCQ28656.1 acyl-CoA dehydrogenase family protein [Caballeronia sp. NK8]
MLTPSPTDRSRDIADRVEAFVRETVIPFECDSRNGPHGPSEELVTELRTLARAAGVMTPHILTDGTHLTHVETAAVLKRSGLSPLGPVAVNTMAPDEGNMFLLGRVATTAQKERFLTKLQTGEARSAFFMTEPAEEQGAGSDPSMLKTTARRDGDAWVIDGSKTFITGAVGAAVGIVMALTKDGDKPRATMFLVDLPDPAIEVVKVLDTIDGSMPGGHARIAIRGLRVPADSVLGEVHAGFEYAQIRLSPARLSHCMRWLGLAVRAQELAVDYASQRHAFGKRLIDHEGVGFMLADNAIDLQQAALMIDWCADVLDRGDLGTTESSMAKVAVSDALFRVADRCVQTMGGSGVSRDSIVEQFFREVRAFRIYDGPTEVHKWSLAKKIKRAALGGSYRV